MINPTEKLVSKAGSVAAASSTSVTLPQQNGTNVYSPNALLARQERVAAPPISPALSAASGPTVVHNEASTSSSSSPIRDPKVESVPKTHVANKRLRKNALSPVSGEPPAKVSKVNGAVCALPTVADHYETRDEPTNVLHNREQSISRVTEPENEETPSTSSSPPPPAAASPAAESVPEPDPPRPKRGRRKKSKKKDSVGVMLKEKLDAASKAVRVKTTEELVAELKSRTENRLHGGVGDGEDASQPNSVNPSLSNTDQTDRGWCNQKGDADWSTLDPEERVEREIASILSKLPPLNVDAIRWDSSPEPPSSPPTPKPVTDADVDRYLGARWDDVNGCATHGAPSSSGDDDGFREWHEMVARRTTNDDLIHILPYCIVD